MSKLLAITLALSATSLGISAHDFEEDQQTLVQARVKRDPPPGFHYKLGEKVHVKGYDDNDNVTIIGYGGGTDRYHLLMKGVGELRNIGGANINRPTPTPPPFSDPAAGPVDYILGFEYRAKPVITGRGEKPGTWNVHIDGMGDIPNVDDGSIIRSKSWLLTSSTTPPRRSNVEKLLARKNSSRARAEEKRLEEKRRFSVANMIENRKEAAAKARLLTQQLEAFHMFESKDPQVQEQPGANATVANASTSSAVPAAGARANSTKAPPQPVLPNNVGDPVEIPLTGPAAELIEYHETLTPANTAEASSKEGNAEEAAGEEGEAAGASGKEENAEQASEQESGLRNGQLAFDLELGDAGERGFTTFLTKGSGHLHELELDIASIAEGGALANWNNKVAPSARIHEGDRIARVNGVAGTAVKLHKALENLPSGSQTLSVVVERKLFQPPPEVSAEQAANALKDLMVTGPKGFLKKNLPFDLGSVLINDKETVQFCSDISSPLFCQNSQKMFGIECAGWGGHSCLSKEKAKCKNIQTYSICKDARSKFGISCAGWGGSSCLPENAHPSLITSELTCRHSERRLGIKSAGWGGSSCLATDAKCSRITAPGICNDAASRLGLSCLGWGGKTCLDVGAEAELITEESLCLKSAKRFGIQSVGWSGRNCISPAKLRCDVIKEPSICSNSMSRLNISCAGWGGHSCLDHHVPAALISSPAICQRSKEVLGIPSAGWSGTRCLEAGTVQCSQITAQGVCNDAKQRLGIECAGWTGHKCLSKEEAKCTVLNSEPVCKSSQRRFGLSCAWNGQFCLPGPR